MFLNPDVKVSEALRRSRSWSPPACRPPRAGAAGLQVSPVVALRSE